MIMTESTRFRVVSLARVIPGFVMLHVLPVELSLAVLSYLPLQALCPLPSLSRKWFNFFSQNLSAIFRSAAILHEYTHPGTYLLEDALYKHKGSPWEGATDWKDFCRLCVPFRRPFHPMYIQYPGA
jgi:hypothetical protein